MSFCIFHSCFVLWRRTFDISKRRTISLTNLTRSFALCEKGQRKMERLCATSVGASVAFMSLPIESCEIEEVLNTTCFLTQLHTSATVLATAVSKKQQAQRAFNCRAWQFWGTNLNGLSSLSLSLSCSMYNIYIYDILHIKDDMFGKVWQACMGHFVLGWVKSSL